jgi:hypothetical protein
MLEPDLRLRSEIKGGLDDKTEQSVIWTLVGAQFETETESASVTEAAAAGILDRFADAERHTCAKRRLGYTVYKVLGYYTAAHMPVPPDAFEAMNSAILTRVRATVRFSAEELLYSCTTVLTPAELAVTAMPWAELQCAEKLRQLLLEILILPRKHPLLFTGTRTPCRSLLLYGPRGCGRSFAVASLMREIAVTLLQCDVTSAALYDNDRVG